MSSSDQKQILPCVSRCAYCAVEFTGRYGRHLQTCTPFRASRGLPPRLVVQRHYVPAFRDHDEACSCTGCNEKEDREEAEEEEGEAEEEEGEAEEEEEEATQFVTPRRGRLGSPQRPNTRERRSARNRRDS